MKTLHVLALVVMIVGGLAIFEYWSATLYPMMDYQPHSLPSLPLGSRLECGYYKEEILVGQYSFWVEAFEEFKGRDAYITKSRTSVTQGGKQVVIETVYVFSEDLSPLEYRLNASLGGEEQFITCVFDEDGVNGTMFTEESTVNQPQELPGDTVLLDNYMFGHWSLFFKTFQPPPGRRVKVNVYIPQMLSWQLLELIADKKTTTVTIAGEDYECNGVRAPKYDLWFYIHDGELLRFEQPEQEIVISLRKQ